MQLNGIRILRPCQSPLDVALLGHEFIAAFGARFRIGQARFDHFKQIGDPARDGRRFAFKFGPLPSTLSGQFPALFAIRLDGSSNGAGRKQMLPERGQNPLLNFGHPDCSRVIAAARVLQFGAPYAAVLHNAETPATAGTTEKARKKTLRAALMVKVGPAPSSSKTA